MKKNILFLLIATFALSFSAFSQTITVTPSKTVYRRAKPMSSDKKTFIVTRPKIKGTTPVLAKKIETSLSYEKSFELSIKDELNDIQWLEEASYTVGYNKFGILNLELNIEGSGAYPSGSTKSVVVDVKSGDRVMPADVFTNLKGLAAKAKDKQNAEIKKSMVDIKKEEPDEDNSDLFKESDFTVDNLSEFSVSDKGITFWYDYDFPHVIQAMQPEGRYFFTWAQMKPYIKQGGLFARFVH